MEEFRKIPGYEDTVYRASSLYGIFNGHKYLKPYSRSVTLRLNGTSTTRKVDELVAAAFVSNPDNKPYLYHRDQDWSNNAADNLVYVTNEDIAEAETDGWKYIPKLYPFYMAHPSGRIRSCSHFTDEVCKGTSLYKFYPVSVLTNIVNSEGYYCVMISANGQSSYVSVHRLVATTFIPNPDELPQVNHKDGNKLNNNVSNLEWSSREHNMQHARDIGLWDPASCGKRAQLLLGHPVRCVDEDIVFPSIAACSRHYGMDGNSIKESIQLNRRRKGHIFEYV